MVYRPRVNGWIVHIHLQTITRTCSIHSTETNDITIYETTVTLIRTHQCRSSFHTSTKKFNVYSIPMVPVHTNCPSKSESNSKLLRSICLLSQRKQDSKTTSVYIIVSYIDWTGSENQSLDQSAEQPNEPSASRFTSCKTGLERSLHQESNKSRRTSNNKLSQSTVNRAKY
jgi:hypothetical protein